MIRGKRKERRKKCEFTSNTCLQSSSNSNEIVIKFRLKIKWTKGLDVHLLMEVMKKFSQSTFNIILSFSSSLFRVDVTVISIYKCFLMQMDIMNVLLSLRWTVILLLNIQNDWFEWNHLTGKRKFDDKVLFFFVYLKCAVNWFQLQCDCIEININDIMRVFDSQLNWNDEL